MYGLTRLRKLLEVRQVVLHQLQLTDVSRLGELQQPGVNVGELVSGEISVLSPPL